MKDNFTLVATKRQDVGKGASRRLRRAGNIPGIVYGAEQEPLAIDVNHNDLMLALQNPAFYSRVLTLQVDSVEEKVILRDLQRHPYKASILHLDLQRISATEKLTMHVPCHFVGEAVAPGVKLGGGLVAHLMTEITVRCLPQDLPEFIEVDVAALELNQTIHLADLKLAPAVEILDLVHGENKPVVTIYVPRAVEETAAVAQSAEVPASEVKADDEAKGA